MKKKILMSLATLSLIGMLAGCGAENNIDNKVTDTPAPSKEVVETTPAETPENEETKETETVVEPEKVALAEDGSNFLEAATDADTVLELISIANNSLGYTVSNSISKGINAPDSWCYGFSKEPYAFGGTMYTTTYTDNATETDARFYIYINEDQTKCYIRSQSSYFDEKFVDATQYAITYSVPNDKIADVLALLNSLETSYHNQCDLFCSTNTKFEKNGDSIYMYCSAADREDSCYVFTVSEYNPSLIISKKTYSNGDYECTETFSFDLNNTPYGANAYNASIFDDPTSTLSEKAVAALCDLIKNSLGRTR